MATTMASRRSGTTAAPTDDDGITRSITRQVTFVTIAIVALAAIFLTATVHAVMVIDGMSVTADTERARVALSRTIVLDDEALAAIEEAYQLTGARLVAPGEVAGFEISLPTGSPDGRVLAWTPRRMGTEVFRAIAPIRISAAVLLIASIAFVLHRLHALARHLDARRAAAHRQAIADSLTGVANRFGFNEALAKLFDGTQEESPQSALLLLDLDGFKDVNDRLGHLAGDGLLAEVARRMKAYAAPEDTVARLGGDEFAIIRRSGLDRSSLAEFATDLIHLLSAPCRTDGRAARVSVSIGVARVRRDGGAYGLIRRADAALYQAKSRKGGCFEFADDEAEPAGVATARVA